MGFTDPLNKRTAGRILAVYPFCRPPLNQLQPTGGLPA